MRIKDISNFYTMTNEDPGAGGAGGSGDAGAADAAAKAAAAANGGNAVAAVKLPDNWRDSLPADLKDEPSLKIMNDFESIVKSYVHAHKSIGMDKAVIPSKHATPEEIKAYYKKAGVPEAKDYKVDVDPKSGVDPKFLENFTKWASDEAVHPTQAKALLTKSLEHLKTVETEAANARQVEIDKGLKSLKDEWGNKFEENKSKVHAAFNKFGTPELKKFLEDTKFGEHPAVIKAFAKIGELLTEDELKANGGSDVQTGNLTPAEAQVKANEILMNPQHPANLKGHPNHKAALAELEGYFQQAYPSTKD